MQDSSAGDRRFTCSNCEMEVIVDDAIRELLLEDGCVRCGAAATPGDFESIRTGD